VVDDGWALAVGPLFRLLDDDAGWAGTGAGSSASSTSLCVEILDMARLTGLMTILPNDEGRATTGSAGRDVDRTMRSGAGTLVKILLATGSAAGCNVRLCIHWGRRAIYPVGTL